MLLSILKILVASCIGLLSVLLYATLYGGPFHTLECTLFRYQCPPVVLDTMVLDDKYRAVLEQFERNFQVGNEIGSCMAATIRGRTVINVCGGSTLDGKPYRGSLQMVFSTSKAISKMVLAMLVDRGLLQYEEKVAVYWPEFAQNGKENVTVGDIARHTSGVVYLDEPLLESDILNLDSLAVKLARQPHNFNSTKVVGYHTVTQGFYINELVRRVDPNKRSIAQFMREEVSKPLGIEFFFGLPESERSRVSPIKQYPVSHFFVRILSRVVLDFLPFIPSHPSKLFYQKLLNKESLIAKSLDFGVTDYNSPLLMDAEIPAANGFTTIEGLSVLAQLMANRGEVNGVRLISEEIATKAMTPFETDFDVVLSKNITRTVGGFAQLKAIAGVEMYGWAGMGGSLFLFDPVHNISFTYLMNGMFPGLATTEGRALDLCQTFLESARKHDINH